MNIDNIDSLDAVNSISLCLYRALVGVVQTMYFTNQIAKQNDKIEK